MLNVLLESRATGERRRAGTIVSVFAHTSVIVAVAVATASGRTRPERSARAEVITGITLPNPKPAPRTPRPEAMPRTGLPHFPAQPLIREGNVGIDFSRIPAGISTEPLTDIDLGDAADSRSSSPFVGGAYGVSLGEPGGVLAAESVDRLATMLPGAGPAYPLRLRRAGITGRVVVRFVVDTLGHVEPDGIQIVSSDHPDFTTTVRESLTTLRFRPAEARGRRVRMLVQLPFEFELK